MAPNLAPSQHDLFRDMILHQKLTIAKWPTLLGVVSVRSKQYAQIFVTSIQITVYTIKISEKFIRQEIIMPTGK